MTITEFTRRKEDVTTVIATFVDALGNTWEHYVKKEFDFSKGRSSEVEFIELTEGECYVTQVYLNKQGKHCVGYVDTIYKDDVNISFEKALQLKDLIMNDKANEVEGIL